MPMTPTQKANRVRWAAGRLGISDDEADRFVRMWEAMRRLEREEAAATAPLPSASD